MNHTIVVKDELLQAHPELAADVFDAFVQAKRVYLDRLTNGGIAKPTKVDALHRRVMEIIGDPLPYGVDPNRKMLEELVQSAHEQGIITRRAAVEELFAPATRGLAG
jgi:4,5-dihydroxyphthalate decarboxylase